MDDPLADSVAITTSYLKVEFTSEDKAEFQGQLLDELPGFTGHEKFKGHNLIHMNGRIYSPAYGRFISADIGVPYPDDWYSYNRYMYVGGNPASRFDPSGFTGRDVQPQQFERMPWESQQGQVQQQVDLQIPANFSLQQYMDVSLSSMNSYSPQLDMMFNQEQNQLGSYFVYSQQESGNSYVQKKSSNPIYDAAKKHIGSNEYNVWTVKGGWRWFGDPKCNLFVLHATTEGGAQVPLINGGKYPPTACQWADTDLSIPGWEVVFQPMPGDVAEISNPSFFATGHVGIVAPNQMTISATPNDGVVLRSWAFRRNEIDYVVFRRYIGVNE